MTQVEIREINSEDDEYGPLLHFRNRLLREPLGLNLFEEDLTEEADDFMLIALLERKILGCVLLRPMDEKCIKLRQMAVDESVQGKGLGKILVTNAEETAVENGYEQVVLNARITARGFYEKLGYEVIGEEFMEVGIPHIAMQKVVS